MIFSLHFAIYNHNFWLIIKSIFSHRETNVTINAFSKMSQKIVIFYCKIESNYLTKNLSGWNWLYGRKLLKQENHSTGLRQITNQNVLTWWLWISLKVLKLSEQKIQKNRLWVPTKWPQILSPKWQHSQIYWTLIQNIYEVLKRTF